MRFLNKLIDEHSTALSGKLFQLLMVLTVKKISTTKSEHVVSNLVTVPSCDGRLILKKTGNIYQY